MFTNAANAVGISKITITSSDGIFVGYLDNIVLNNVAGASNNAPTATNLTQTVPFTEDGGSVALGDIVVTDVDSGETITATLTLGSTAAGVLTTGTFGSATSTYNAGTGVWTVTGSVSDVNAALAVVAFTPSANWDQDVTITTRIRDAANTGPADGTITLDATAVNDAPVATTSGGSTSFTEGGGAVVVDSDFILSDVDSTNMTGATIEITSGYETPWDQLDVQDAFAFQGAGVTYSYDSSTGIMTLAGTATAAQYQSLIRQIVYFNNSDDPSTANRTISITVNDGTNNSDPATKTLTVTSVNDVPTATNLTQTVPFTEDGGSAALGDIVITDVDGDTVTATLTLGDSAAGSLSTGTFGSATSTYNAGTGVWTVTGSVTDVNAALAAVAFTPSANWDQDVTITTRIRDAADTGPADGTITLDATAVNDAPTATNLTQTVPFTEDGGSVALGDIVVTDVDSGETITATLTLGSTAAGVLTTGTFGSATSTYNAGTGVWTVTGSVSDVNAALAAVAFTPSANWDQDVTITTRIRDAADTGPADGTITLDATAVNDAPVATASGGSTSFTEGGGAVVVDSAFTLSDVDSSNMTGATIEITGNFQNGSDILAFTNQNGITGSYNAGTGVLTLSGSASAANYQAAIRSITFGNSSDDPSTANRTISITVNDGTNNSGPATKTLSVTGVNDAPTLSATGGTPSFTENGSAVDLFSDVTISAVESGQTITGMTFSVTNAETSDTITFDGKAIALSDGLSGTTVGNSLTYNVSVSGGVAMITVSGGNLTTADAQTVIDGMTYSSSSDNPGTANRVVTLTGITDSGGTANDGVDSVSVSVASTVTVNAVNDAPGLANGGNSVSFSAGSGTEIVINDGLTVWDVDNTTLALASVSITSGFATGDTLGFIPDGAFGNITGSYNAGTGVLSLSSAGGTATVAEWQAALRSVTFSNAEASPATGMRTVSFVVNDGSDSSSSSNSSVGIVFAPVIGNLDGDSVTYTEGGSAVAIDAGAVATVTDSDNANFNGGNLTVSITAGGDAAQDILTLDTGGGTITLAGTTAGSTVSVGGTVIGTLANNIVPGNDLVINFDENATPARVESLLAAIQYSNNSTDDPTAGPRTVRVTLTDASGGFTSSPADVTVNVVGSTMHRRFRPPVATRPLPKTARRLICSLA